MPFHSVPDHLFAKFWDTRVSRGIGSCHKPNCHNSIEAVSLLAPNHHALILAGSNPTPAQRSGMCWLFPAPSRLVCVASFLVNAFAVGETRMANRKKEKKKYVRNPQKQ